MTPGVYVAGCEPATGKSAVALGVQQLLARRVERLGVFRPVVADAEHDPLIDLLRPATSCPTRRPAASATRRCAPTRRARWRRSSRATGRWPRSATACSSSAPTSWARGRRELAFNARVALNLGLPAVLVVSGHDRTPAEVGEATSVGADDLAALGARRRRRGRQPRAGRRSTRSPLRAEPPSTRCPRSTC